MNVSFLELLEMEKVKVEAITKAEDMLKEYKNMLNSEEGKKQTAFIDKNPDEAIKNFENYINSLEEGLYNIRKELAQYFLLMKGIIEDVKYEIAEDFMG